MEWQAFFLNPAVVWVLIPITFALTSGIQALYRAYCEHVERMAMIQQGMMPPDRTAADSDECLAG
jgi:hypothetical protein